MEGAIFVTGAAVQWLRDGLGVIADAAETGPLAESVPDSGGVYVVPAFTGLGSPWWDAYARGTIVGITRGTGRAHLARAVVESMAFQTADVVDAITRASGTAPAEMRIDGGASVDGPAVPVPGRPARRSRAPRRGAGDDRARRRVPRRHRRRRVGLARHRERDLAGRGVVHARRWTPADRDARMATWHRAVERSRDWARE